MLLLCQSGILIPASGNIVVVSADEEENSNAF